MLDEKQIELIDRKLSHVHKKHIGELLDITNRLVNQIDPNNNATVEISLKVIPQNTLEALAHYGEDIVREVIGTVSVLHFLKGVR